MDAVLDLRVLSGGLPGAAWFLWLLRCSRASLLGKIWGKDRYPGPRDRQARAKALRFHCFWEVELGKEPEKRVRAMVISLPGCQFSWGLMNMP